MSDNQSSPLLGSSQRPTSAHSHHTNESHESQPLLSRTDGTPRYDGEVDANERIPSPAATSLRSLQSHGPGSIKSTKGGRRWPTMIAVGTLGLVVVGILIGAFCAPAIVEEYAKESLVIEPTNLSIHSFTTTGVRARVQANFKLDASRVKSGTIRKLGRLGTWVAKEVESKEALVEVYLPEYGNVLIGTAVVPGIVVNIRDGRTTQIDFLTDLAPGDMDGVLRIANDWLEGRLDQIRILGKTDVVLKSGLIPLGSQKISESLVFEGNDIPAIPAYNITKLNFREIPVSTTGQRGMAADVSISLINSYPIKLSIPPLGFDILVPNCGPDDNYIRLADATTATINVEPHSEVNIDVGGVVHDLPKNLLKTCPHSHSSPLDLLLGEYIHGNDTTIFVRGSNAPGADTPEWIAKLISSVTVPVPFPGHTFDNVIQNFSLTDTHFSLPDPWAEPDTDESKPQVSANIMVLAGIPQEMNFGINVTRVRANADVFYEGNKLGELNLKKWQKAQSKRVNSTGDDAAIEIESQIKNAPLTVTDDDVFTDVLQALLFGGDGKAVMLKIEALVDIEVSTVLGAFVIKGMPAEGIVPVKPISTGEDFSKLKPKVGDLAILDTGKTSLDLEANVNFTNPTEYTAHVPFINIHILHNGSIIGEATARDVDVVAGDNTNIIVQATWDPTRLGGEKGRNISRELISQYVSGFNTTLTFRTHEGSIPGQPGLGLALSKFEIEIPTPRLSTPNTGHGHDDPDEDEDNRPHFIDDATFHLFTSTATFTLLSPLQHSSIYIESIDATAFYNHTEPVGRIEYDLPFKVPPGSSTTPKLPVDWSLDSVGYDAVRKALGGKLKLDARGTVGVRLGRWSETIWYIGGGIGASVRL
ncbi:hypothetical protein BP6252_12171 [Coleophoma cylindrospora]|uniref:Pre-rRNA processing protein n=1 Tax=Coleophoma cylindrospora TaxID=1849047 RepID=A0A3D8QGH1_9HELO|nr:hypothetical protein BP6252_12171 [Coleophoma cylindrospora]